MFPSLISHAPPLPAAHPPDEDPNEAIYEALTPFYNGGHDREGRPIHWERTGVYNLPKVFKLLTPEDLVQRHIREQALALQNMEVGACGWSDGSHHGLAPALIQTLHLPCSFTEKVQGARQACGPAGRHHGPQGPIPLTQQQGPRRLSRVFPRRSGKAICFLILLPYTHAPPDFAHSPRRHTVLQAFFPETLGHCFLINAPWIFHPLWAIVKPWLDSHTRSKFHVLGEAKTDAASPNVRSPTALTQRIRLNLLITRWRLPRYPSQAH